MKNLYQKETMEHKDDPIVKKYLKQILINKICWSVGTGIALILTIVLAVIGTKWDKLPYITAILVPALLTVISGFMTVVIFLGNEVGVKMYKNDKITFYSGPGTNCLYINDKLIAKSSNEKKLTGTVSDGSIVKIALKTISFRIDILPPAPVNPVPPAKPAATEQPKPQA